MPCPYIQSCALPALFAVRGSLAVWTLYYCNGDFMRCERLRLTQAGREPPFNLLPNGRLLSPARPLEL